jgi:hypothetical protein
VAVGKTIQVFLPDGNPRGVRIAEITSRTVQAISIPRSQLDIALERAEAANVGVYFLIGTSEEQGKPLLYVGEAENCRDRWAKLRTAVTGLSSTTGTRIFGILQ